MCDIIRWLNNDDIMALRHILFVYFPASHAITMYIIMIQTLHQSVLLFALEHSTTVLNQVRMISTMLTELNMQNAVWKC